MTTLTNPEYSLIACLFKSSWMCWVDNMLADHTLYLGPHISNRNPYFPTILLYISKISTILNSNSISFFIYNFTIHLLLTLSWWSCFCILKNRVKRMCLLFLEACLHMNIHLLPSMNVSDISVPILDDSLSPICTWSHKLLSLEEFVLKCSLSLHQ